MVIDRRCRLERDRATGWCRVVFADETPEESAARRWALPCRLLERMESVAARKPKAIFRISGENTIYDGRCFLLVQKAVLEIKPPPTVPSRAASSQPASAPESSENRTNAAASQAAAVEPIATQPTSSVAASQPESREHAGDGGATSEEILTALQQDREGAPVLAGTRPTTDRATEPSVAPLPKVKALAPGRGGAVVDRLVTLVVPEVGQWMEVRFESDNTLREPPLRLLPCAALRKAEVISASAEKGKTIRLRVSGLVTYYRGKRFLLLRKALLERDLGRF